jgi:hypothetical protein
MWLQLRLLDALVEFKIVADRISNAHCTSKLRNSESNSGSGSSIISKQSYLNCLHIIFHVRLKQASQWQLIVMDSSH